MEFQLANSRRHFANSRRHFDAFFRYNLDGRKIDATSTYFFSCVFERQKVMVVLVPLIDKILVFQK